MRRDEIETPEDLIEVMRRWSEEGWNVDVLVERQTRPMILEALADEEMAGIELKDDHHGQPGKPALVELLLFVANHSGVINFDQTNCDET